jgi:hypothetical protein
MTHRMLRKLVKAGAVIALMTGTASAQMPMAISPFKAPDKAPLTKEEQDKQKAAEKAYRAAVGKIPEKKGGDDPWGNVRPAPPATAKNKQ